MKNVSTNRRLKAAELDKIVDELIAHFSVNLQNADIPHKLLQLGYSLGPYQINSVLRRFRHQRMRFIDGRELMSVPLSKEKTYFRVDIHTKVNELIAVISQVLDVPHDQVLDTAMSMIAERAALGKLNLLQELEVASAYGTAEIDWLIANVEKLSG